MSDLLEEARLLVSTWRPRLGIAEIINVELVDDDASSDRELESRCLPVERDGQGLWEFTVQIGDTIERERLEPAVVHELVHVLVEPLREAYFDGARVDRHSTEEVMFLVAPKEPFLERWETVVDRLADAYLRAYQAYASQRAAIRKAISDRELRAPA